MRIPYVNQIATPAQPVQGPRIGPGEAGVGQTAAAVGNLANTVSQIADRQIREDVQRREDAALFAARKEAVDAVPLWNKYLDDQRKAVPKDDTAETYLAGMTDRAEKDFQKWKDEKLSTMTSTRARQDLDLSLSGIRNSVLGSTLSYQTGELSKLKLAALNGTFEKNDATVFVDPHLAQTIIDMESKMLEAVPGADPAHLKTMQQARAQKINDTALAGSVQAIINDPFGMKLDEIKGFRDALQTKGAAGHTGASQEAIQRAQNQLNSLIATRDAAAQKQNLDAVQERIREQSAGNANGLSIKEADFIQDPDTRAKVQKQIIAANLAGEAVRSVAAAPMSEIVRMFNADAENLRKSGNYDQDVMVLQARRSAFEQRIQQENADPAGYAMKVNKTVENAYNRMQSDPTDANVKSYVSLLSATQQQLNPGRITTILPTAQADALTADINQRIATGQGAGEVIAAEAKKWGDYWPSVYGQISKGLPPDAYLIGSGMRSADANYLASLSKLKPEELKKGIDNTRLTGFDSAMASKYQEFIQTLTVQPGGGDAVAKIMSSSEKLVYGYMAQEPGLSLSKAVDRAYEATVGHKYAIDGNARIPKEFKGAPVDASKVMKGAQNIRDQLENVPMAIPRDPTLRPGDEKADYVARVRNNGVWLTNPDETGLALYVKDVAGVYSVVRTSKGQPIEYSWASLTAKAPASSWFGYNPASGAAVPSRALTPADLIPDAHPMPSDSPPVPPTAANAKQSVKQQKAVIPGKNAAVTEPR